MSPACNHRWQATSSVPVKHWTPTHRRTQERNGPLGKDYWLLKDYQINCHGNDTARTWRPLANTRQNFCRLGKTHVGTVGRYLLHLREIMDEDAATGVSKPLRSPFLYLSLKEKINPLPEESSEHLEPVNLVFHTLVYRHVCAHNHCTTINSVCITKPEITKKKQNQFCWCLLISDCRISLLGCRLDRSWLSVQGLSRCHLTPKRVTKKLYIM